MAVWLIRCGDSGKEEHKERFFRDDVVAIGYGLKRPVTDFTTRQEVRDSVDMAARADAAGDAGKLWRFAGREDAATDPPLQIGDLVLTPYNESSGRMFAIGEVTGDYHFNAQDLGVRNPHWRAVRWQYHIPITDDLPAEVRQLLDYRSGFQRALHFREADLQQFLDGRNAPA